MPDSPLPEPTTAEQDWRDYLETCGLGEPDLDDFDYHGTLSGEREADEYERARAQAAAGRDSQAER